ncbi:ribosome maturation factor RimM [Microvirga terrestris]|uniref:Ribosome maturation factor RimM n=1 Tax=Microvirga terrestris TaxID=2791024 RepID=A0ABS0HVF1_9HYPH|nr:ribosome maturation factor RimM [Microvirga terrestris]MBF9197481.1 ribosome maturation factor RimM [Microvirga terrestris]
MKKGRSNQRPASPLPLVGRGRGGGASANLSKGALTPPPPSPPHKGEEGRLELVRNDLVLVAEFGRAHGLKGEVRLKSHTGDPQAIADYRPLIASNGKTYSLKSVRTAPGGAPDMLIAIVDSVTTREAAEALNRVQLHVERDKLPPPDEEDEFLLADLIGLPVQNEAGDVIGSVVAVPNYGGGDLLEIAPAPKGPTAFLPFTKAFVPVVDIAAKRIVAVPPDDLFEPAKPQPEDEA